MATLINEQGFKLAAPVNNETLLMVEKALQYQNIFAPDMLNLYAYYPGVKDKVKMKNLKVPKNIMQPAKGCSHWNPNVRMKMRPDEISVCKFEVNGEMCADEFDEGCVQNMQGAGNGRTYISQMPASVQPLVAVMYDLIRVGQVDSIYKIAWFGSSTFNSNTPDWYEDLEADTNMTEDQIEDLVNMLRACGGWWEEIKARTSATGGDKIAYVDSYDGAAPNATDPNDVQEFLQAMIDAAPAELKFYNRAATDIRMRPMFLVQDNIYQAYVQSLRALGADQSFTLTIEGADVPGVMRFDKYLLVSVAEWDMFDEEIGVAGKNARALFTVPQNLALAFDAAGVDIPSLRDYSLLIKERSDLKDKGLIDIYSAMKLGTGIQSPNLMVASWNSVVLP